MTPSEGWIVIRENNTFRIGTKFLGGPDQGLRLARYEKDDDGTVSKRLTTDPDHPIIHSFGALYPYLMRIDSQSTRRH